MSRRIILLLVLLITLIAGVFVYFKIINSSATDGTNTPSGLFKSLLPFGTSPASNTVFSNPATSLFIGTTTDNGAVITGALPRLRHYTTEPTSGSIVLQRESDVIKDRVKIKEKNYFVRYIDRATGHIYESKTTEPNIVTKISNTTIPKIYEALFLPSGSSLLARSLDKNEKITTYFITLKDKIVVSTTTPKGATTTNTVAAKKAQEKSVLKDAVGTYLTEDIREIALSPSGSRILESTYNGDRGLLSVVDGAKSPRPILDIALRDWLVALPSESKAVITTKPSGVSDGYSYILDIATGSYKKIAGDLLGLTVLASKNLDSFLIGEGGTSLQLSVIKSAQESLKLSINTLPEKCAWLQNTSFIYCAVPTTVPQAVYPDDWYKGRVSFTDSLWRINTTTGETNIVADLSKESKQAIDAISLQITNDGNYITFINKKDLTLWGIDLSTTKNSPVQQKKQTAEEARLCSTELALTTPIKFGSKNNPEDVKLLETFLNTYEGTNLSVDGVYDKADLEAVIEWQEKYKADILTPWNLTKGTGYVFTTSLKKIKEIVNACK